MKHEQDYDRRTATPEVKTLDEVVRDVVALDPIPLHQLPPGWGRVISDTDGLRVAHEFREAVNTDELKQLLEKASKIPPHVVLFSEKGPLPPKINPPREDYFPKRRNYAAEMARDAMNFAAKISRRVTGHPKQLPFPPDFRV